MHTNPAPAFARGEPVTLEDLDVERRAQELVINLTEPHMEALGDSPLRHKVYRYRKVEERACPFVAIAALMIAIANNEGSDAELQAAEIFFSTLRQELSVGTARRSLGVVDLEEQQRESAENEQTTEIHVLGETPWRLRQGAKTDREEAATLLERATRREQRARELERGTFMRPMGAIAAGAGR